MALQHARHAARAAVPDHHLAALAARRQQRARRVERDAACHTLLQALLDVLRQAHQVGGVCGGVRRGPAGRWVRVSGGAARYGAAGLCKGA